MPYCYVEDMSIVALCLGVCVRANLVHFVEMVAIWGILEISDVCFVLARLGNALLVIPVAFLCVKVCLGCLQTFTVHFLSSSSWCKE